MGSDLKTRFVALIALVVGAALLCGAYALVSPATARVVVLQANDLGTVTTNTLISFTQYNHVKISTATTGLTYTINTTGLLKDQRIQVDSYITGAILAGPTWTASPGPVKWQGGTSHPSSTTSGYVDIEAFEWDGTQLIELAAPFGAH